MPAARKDIATMRPPLTSRTLALALSLVLIASALQAAPLPGTPPPRAARAAGAWTSVPSGTTETLADIACATPSLCFAVGGDQNLDVLQASTDGGATWHSDDNGSVHDLNAIACPSATTCVAVGDFASVLVTTNGGSTWTTVQTPLAGTATNLYGVACPTASSCTAVGGNGAVLATADGGATWTSQDNDMRTILFDIACTSTGICFAVTGVGRVYGHGLPMAPTLWLTGSPITTQELYGIACATSTTCMTVGASGAILTTTNAGAFWTPSTSGTTTDLAGVACATPTTCLAVGASGTLLVTSNAGLSWTAQPSGTALRLLRVTCPTPTACLAVGVNGTIITGAPDLTAVPSPIASPTPGRLPVIITYPPTRTPVPLAAQASPTASPAPAATTPTAPAISTAAPTAQPAYHFSARVVIVPGTRTTTYRFFWTPVRGAAHYLLQLRPVKPVRATRSALLTFRLSGTQYTLDTRHVPNGTYAWRIIPLSSAGTPIGAGTAYRPLSIHAGAATP
jgi:photosystem II stability/assembly factor-like uncharacterized protein